MKIKNILFLYILFSIIYTKADAQDVLLREDREKDPVNTYFGANEKHYLNMFFGTGFIAGRADGDVAIRYRNSNEFVAGIKYKFKLNSVFSVGADLSYRYTKFEIAQRKEMDFPDTVFFTGTNTHESEKIGFHALPLNIFIRTNFDPHRGNTTGTYLEIGGSGEWVMGNEYVVDDVLGDKTKRKTKYTGMPFVNPFQYHASAKIGLRWLALGVRYRFSDYFKSAYNFPELPRYSITAEIQFVK